MVTNRKSWLRVCFVLSLVIILVASNYLWNKSFDIFLGFVFLVLAFFSFRMKLFILDSFNNVNFYSILCFAFGVVLIVNFFVRFLQ